MAGALARVRRRPRRAASKTPGAKKAAAAHWEPGGLTLTTNDVSILEWAAAGTLYLKKCSCGISEWEWCKQQWSEG